VSNFPAGLLRRAIAANVGLSCLQVENHALLDQSRLHGLCREAGMVLTAYTPLGKGVVAAEPAVTAELQLSDRNVDLLEEGIDVALRIGELRESGLVARRVGAVRRLVAASPGYLSARGTPAVPDDLATHDIVVFQSRATPPEWRFVSPEGREVTLRMAPRFVVNEARAAVGAAVAGHGVLSALSYQMAEELESGTLVRVLPDWEPPALPVSLVFPSARLLPPRVRAFLDFAVPRLSALVVLRE
jgi:DNA-binding transcriptional LysR family regulator